MATKVTLGKVTVLRMLKDYYGDITHSARGCYSIFYNGTYVFLAIKC